MKPAPNHSAHATPAPTRSWTASSGEILKPEDTGLQTTDPDKNGFVGRLPDAACGYFTAHGIRMTYASDEFQQQFHNPTPLKV
jgi:hypothetical protein